MKIIGKIDYLRLSFYRLDLPYAAQILGLNGEIRGFGRYGYTRTYGDDSLGIYFSEEREKCTMQATGSGMDALREVWGNELDALRALSNLRGVTSPRLDYAWDIHSISASPSHVWDAHGDEKMRTKAKTISRIQSRGESHGYTVYLGSRSSDRFIRVYDKSAQLRSLAEFVTRIELVTARKWADKLYTESLGHGATEPSRAIVADMIPHWGVGWADDAMSPNSAINPPKLGRAEGNADYFVRNVIVPFLTKRWDEISIDAKRLLIAATSRASRK